MNKINEALSKMRELALSWDLKEAVEFAKTEEGLKALSELLRDRNPRVRFRALSVLSRVVDEATSERKRLLELFFDPLMLLLESGDEKVCVRVLPILKRLLERAHLGRSEFERLIQSLFSLAEKGDGIIWNEVVEVLKATPITVMPSGAGSVARNYLNSENLRTAVAGAYIIVREGDTLQGISADFLDVLGRALKSNDPITVELVLMTINGILRTPPVYPFDVLLLGLVPHLRWLSVQGSDITIRYGAKKALGTVLNKLREYYQKNLWDAERGIKYLAEGGIKDDTLLIASLVGDPSILLSGEEGPNFGDVLGENEGMGGREL
ncbi:MAG: hypothetical protein J7L37_00485 [Thermococcus sp.]|nr:hypothetical protein [Thermococcus sp.]